MTQLRRLRPVMGTFVEITLKQDSKGQHQKAFDNAFSVMTLIDRLMSFHQPSSELTQLNQSAGEWLTLHPFTYDVLCLAKQMMQASEYAFNCTVGGVLVDQGILPNHQFNAFQLKGTASDIELDAGKARLKRPLLITLDGIAKGYAIDKAIESLQADGMVAGSVNAGGDLRLFGGCLAPIQRRELDNSLSYIGHHMNTAIATSSVGHEFEKRFPGMVVDADSQIRRGIWTVKAPHAWVADALTKVVASLPEQKATSLLDRFSAQLVYGLSI